jgi:anaerobic ribonucleoside-triphosphate reductase activating protein
MNYLQINPCSVTDGPGVRVTIYVSGCNRHCPGCHNPESWNFCAGEPFTQETIDKVIALLAPRYITGLTICGGEPMEPANREEVLRLIREVREVYDWEKTIWLYTGYEIDEFADATSLGILSLINTAVTGPYDQTKRDVSHHNQWRGSTNQKIINLR